MKSEEINLACLNPERLPMHIPVVLDEVEMRPLSRILSICRVSIDGDGIHP